MEEHDPQPSPDEHADSTTCSVPDEFVDAEECVLCDSLSTSSTYDSDDSIRALPPTTPPPLQVLNLQRPPMPNADNSSSSNPVAQCTPQYFNGCFSKTVSPISPIPDNPDDSDFPERVERPIYIPNVGPVVAPLDLAPVPNVAPGPSSQTNFRGPHTSATYTSQTTQTSPFRQVPLTWRRIPSPANFTRAFPQLDIRPLFQPMHSRIYSGPHPSTIPGMGMQIRRNNRQQQHQPIPWDAPSTSVQPYSWNPIGDHDYACPLANVPTRTQHHELSYNGYPPVYCPYSAYPPANNQGRLYPVEEVRSQNNLRYNMLSEGLYPVEEVRSQNNLRYNMLPGRLYPVEEVRSQNNLRNNMLPERLYPAEEVRSQNNLRYNMLPEGLYPVEEVRSQNNLRYNMLPPLTEQPINNHTFGPFPQPESRHRLELTLDGRRLNPCSTVHSYINVNGEWVYRGTEYLFNAQLE